LVVIDDKIRLTEKQLCGAELLADVTKKYILFYGGSRSGKTFLACHFIRHRARKYAGSKHLIARYSFANAKKTVWIQTLRPLLREDERRGLCSINETTGITTYKNGSIVVLGGLEPSRIDSVLAAEYATIFITEANENKFSDVEQLFSRLNDTAMDEDGNIIPLRFICDLNPTVNSHWTNILFRAGLDPQTKEPRANYHEFGFLHFRPEDNEENLAGGYIESLRSLSPAMKKRFYEGEYGAYEGLVYQLDEPVHIVDDFGIPRQWARGMAIDFGYTHAFGCLWGALDESNETLYIYKEYKQKRITVRQHSIVLKEMMGWNGEGHFRQEDYVSWIVTDHDAEDRATLKENEIITLPANKEVLVGIDNVVDLLYHDEDKKTNIKIFRSCTELISEMYSYRWKEQTTVRLPKDREVVKEDDDLCDCLRYLVMKFFPDNKLPGYILGSGYKEKKRELEKQGQSPGFIFGGNPYDYLIRSKR